MDGEELKEAGMEQALGRADVPPWRERFEQCVFAMPKGYYLTSEDVTADPSVGLPSGSVARDGNNAVGGAINALAKRGLIRKTGLRRNSRRPTSHAAELTVWERI